MDSKIYGVPLSTTQGSPPANVPLFTSTGIRAPLTIDDSDFEYSISDNGLKDNNSYYGSSDTGFDSEGFVSGEEDGFETASEKLFVSDPDGQFVVSRPFVKNPDEEFVERGSSVGDFDDSRSSLTDPYAEINEGHGEYSDRPFVVDREVLEGHDEFSDSPFVVDELATGTSMDGSDNDNSLEGTRVVDSAIRGIPIAQLSWDSEDDEYLSTGVIEDNDVSGAFRIPNAVVLDRLDSAPKVRISDVSDYESESENENVTQSGRADDLIYTKNVEMVLGSNSKEEDKAEIDTVQNFISEGGEANDTLEGGIVLYQVASKESTLFRQELDNDEKLLAEESEILDSSAEAKSADSSRDLKPSDTAYTRPREENIVSKFGADELNSRNSIILLTGDSGDSQKSESNEDGVYQGNDCRDIATGTEAESYDKLIKDIEVESLECTGVSVPPTAEEQVCSSASSSSDVTWSSTAEDDLPKLSDKTQHREACLNPDLETNCKNIDTVKLFKNEEVPFVHENDESLTFDGSGGMKLIIDQLDQQIATADYDGEVSQGHLPKVDGEIVRDSDEEVDTDEESEDNDMFDAEALAALLRAATGGGPEGRNVTIPSADSTQVFSLELPGSSGSTFHSSRPGQPTNADKFPLSENKTEDISEGILSEEEKKKLEKLQQLRVKFLRLIHKLNRSSDDSVAAQVLYRLVRAAGKSASHVSSLDSAQKVAMKLEAEDTDSLNFSLNILVIGKTGVGKSATINSIFGEAKSMVDAFVPATTNVKEIIGQLDGVTLNILDTPGFRSSPTEQSINRRTLLSIKKYMKKYSPDVVLYVDRIDTQSRDVGDLPLLKSISSYLGPSIWHNAIVTLTHAASSPPDGPSGYPVSYEMFVAQCSRIIQQLIDHSIGNPHTVNAGFISRPFALVENHSVSPKNDKGEILLPNGENWRSQLLLLCYSIKILSEVDSIMKDQDLHGHRKLFGFPKRSLPLPYFLSSLLQSNVHPKVQAGEDMDSDTELAYSSESDLEVEDYDDLPPFRPLRKSQIAKLSKEQKRAYFDEYDYRVKLLQKKQWREELKRLRDMKKKGKAEIGDYMEEGADQETGSQAGVAIPLPDMALPSSFDGDNATYRYRYLEPSSQLLARPVMDSQGWDHDCGYDGVSIEDHLAIAGQFPAVIVLQLTKDKKEFNIHLDSSVSAKTGKKGSTMVGFDIQTVGKQLAYILKGETKVKNLKTNKTAAGVSITFLGHNLVTGLKLEDHFAIGKQLVMVGSTGTIRSQGDAAYGANLELRLREKDYPIDQDQISLGLSLMKWRNDIIWGCNLQTQFSVGRNSKIAVRAGLNSKKSGQITVRTSTSDQLQIAILGLLPIARAIMMTLFPQTKGENLT